MGDMGKAVIINVPTALYERIQQAMRDEGIEPDRASVNRWIIGALTFTAAACSTEGYRDICRLLRHDPHAADNTLAAPLPRSPAGKGPRSD